MMPAVVRGSRMRAAVQRTAVSMTSGSLVLDVAMCPAAEGAGSLGAGAAKGMTALAGADPASRAFATPGERGRVGVPGAGGRFQPGDQLLGGLRVLPLQGTADEDALEGFGHNKPTPRQRGVEHHDAVGEEPEHEFGGMVARQVIPDEQEAQRWELRRQGNADPQARLPARPLRAVHDGSGMSGARIARIEGRHRSTGGGNALRAAVLGASDGLTSNLSLVMGVAGANLAGRAILLTGLAGMLAGGLSMAIGEWLSVQSARDLYEHQIGIERQELAETPEEERQELAQIYEAKGIDCVLAEALAQQLISRGDAALDTLAREELGLDPAESNSAAFVAAFTSFLLFSFGAIVPVLAFFFLGGLTAVAVSLILSVGGLFLIGVGISLTTGVAVLKTGGRQVALGLLAALVTFGIGKLIGQAIG